MVCLAFFLVRLLAPKKPTPEKLTSYECGEEPVGSAWLPFNSRFYVIALVFLLFEVELIFVFPWATVFGQRAINEIDNRWSKLTLIEMFIFLGILISGLAYVWVKGDLNWIKPRPVPPVSDASIPMSAYERLNAEQSTYKVREFSAEPSTANAAAPAANAGQPASIRKPMFKPTFKKPGNE